MFEESLLRYPCEACITRGAMGLSRRVAPQESLREQLARAGPEDEEGFRAVSLCLESKEVAASQVLALGDGVEVLAPLALRARLPSSPPGCARATHLAA